MQVTEDRPPYVRFELRSMEDRAASIAQGHYVGKDVAFAIITPAGTRDQIERVVEDWFVMLRQQVAEGRFPAQWLKAYESIFEDWSAGREIPETGTPILTWPVLRPSQRDAILSANIRTVEDLANANEAALNTIGIGSRTLKNQAIEWLATAKDVGKTSEEINALKVKLEALEADVQGKAEKIRDLEKALEEAKKVKV